MRTESLGDGTPEIAVLGGVHGDEPCGVNAIERVLEADPDLRRPVKFVVANEKALEQRERSIEEDLNRAFPGDENGVTHESRLAGRVEREICHCTTLSMHSTQSYGGTFALVDGQSRERRQILPHLSVDAVVDVGRHSRGRAFEVVPELIEVECGYQGTPQATENAVEVVWEFLTAVGAMSGEQRSQNEHPLFRLERQIPKTEAGSYDVYASNFERVAVGEPYAAADGDEVVADEPFYPVLLSPYGYEDVFGYTAERLGTVSQTETENEAV